MELYENENTLNKEMVDCVEMRCKKCGGPVTYKVLDRCPFCGMIEISCAKCKYEFRFGE